MAGISENDRRFTSHSICKTTLQKTGVYPGTNLSVLIREVVAFQGLNCITKPISGHFLKWSEYRGGLKYFSGSD